MSCSGSHAHDGVGAAIGGSGSAVGSAVGAVIGLGAVASQMCGWLLQQPSQA